MLTITMKSLFFFYISFTITTDVTCCKAEIKTKNTKLGNANEVDLALVMSYLRTCSLLPERKQKVTLTAG